MTDSDIPRGWGYLINASKWHYFVDSRSLCGRWLCLNSRSLEDKNDDSPDNCRACVRKVKKIRIEDISSV